MLKGVGSAGKSRWLAAPSAESVEHQAWSTMATTNGGLTPPTVSNTATSPANGADLKRKREDDEAPDTRATGSGRESRTQTQKDILDILKP